jgi:flagellar biosynthesis protein FlhF
MTAAVSEPKLFLKSFFADSVEETLDRARLELGPDALLLHERETPPESRHLGAFEVVFGIKPATPRPTSLVSGERIENLQQTLEGMLHRMNKDRLPGVPAQPELALRPHPQPAPAGQPYMAVMSRPWAPQRPQAAPTPPEAPVSEPAPAEPVAGANPAGKPNPGALPYVAAKSRPWAQPRPPAAAPTTTVTARSFIAQRLIADGVDAALAAEIDETVQRRLRTRSIVQIGRSGAPVTWKAEELVKETIAELEARFEVSPEIGRRTVLVGPPGAGKTTTLVKLAVVRGLALGRAVSLVSMDDGRIGAVEQLRAYAGILNVPFQVAGTPEALAQVINATPAETLLLIDTPGHTALTMEDSGHRLADFLRRRQDIDAHLVLTASMREADLRRAVDRFQVFAPAKLLFTHLDETDATGSMLSEAARTRRPLSFLCTGQTVPEDIAPASKAKISRPLARQLPQALQAVA